MEAREAREMTAEHDAAQGSAPESARVARRDAGRRAFRPKEIRILAAIVEAMLSDESDRALVAPPPDVLRRIVDELDLWVGAGSTDLRRGYRVLVWLIEWLPVVVIGAFTRATRLSLGRRLAYLVRLEHARPAILGTLIPAFKLPVILLAFELDPYLRITGFDRETVSTPRTLLGPRKVQAG